MHKPDFTRICTVAAVALGLTLLVPGCAGKIIDDPDATKQSVYLGPGGGGSGGSSAGAHGLTFGFAADPKIADDLVHPSCHGFPKGVDHAWRDSCNPYEGDTACSNARPILCVHMDNTPAPTNLSFDFYNGWVPGELASTTPIVGKRLTSLAAANAICEAQLGSGFRMASFHDAEGDGGWTFTGKRGTIDESARHWVYIDDQAGNCWNSR